MDIDSGAAPAAAGDRAERERLCQEVLAACAWRQSRTPPPLCESPPCASKTAALAYIAAQLHRPPHEDRPGFVPVATVLVAESRADARASAGGAASGAVVAVACRTGDPLGLPRSSSSKDSDLFASGAVRGGEKTPGGSSDEVPSDFDEPTDAEVGKWSFHQRLVHYLDGEMISHSVRKAVEIVILVEGGTYVRNLNPMKKPQMGELLLSKYRSLIENIEDRHFVSGVVCDDMKRGYKGAKKALTGDNLWRKLEKEMTQLKTFASKFLGVNCPLKLPSGTAQLHQMKKPCIMKLWKEQNPVTLFDCCLISLLRSVLTAFVCRVDSSRHRLR
jgi:hypothetical protein